MQWRQDAPWATFPGMRGMVGVVLLLMASCGKCAGALPSDGLPERAAKRLSREFPQAAVRVVDERTLRLDVDGGVSVQLGLDNLRLGCAGGGEACDALLERMVESSRQALTPDDFALTREVVRATLKTSADLANLRRMTADGGAGKQVVSRPAFAGLEVVFVADRPSMVQLLTRAQVDELKVDDAALEALALANLEAALPPLEAEPFAGNEDVLVSGSGESYAATQVLFPQRFAPFAQKLGGTLTVAIPTRGVVLMTGSTESERLAGLRRVVEHLVANEPYPLTAELLRWSKDGWTVVPREP